MLDVVRELVDAVADLRGITSNRRAELHAQLDAADKPKRGGAATDVPSGA